MTQTGVRWLLGLLFVLTSQAMENLEDVYAQDDEWLQRPMDYEIIIDERFERFGKKNWQDLSGKVFPGGVYKFQHLSANGSPVFKGPEFTMWRGNAVIRDQDQKDRSFNDAGTWYWAPNSIVKTAEREGETVRLIGDLEGHENNDKSIYRWIGLNVVTPITGRISDGSPWEHYTRLDEYDARGRKNRRSWDGFFLNNMIVRARELPAQERERVRKQIADRERSTDESKRRDAAEAQDTGNVCDICQTNPPETVITTCGHQTPADQCHECIKSRICPDCREPFGRDDIIRVFV